MSDRTQFSRPVLLSTLWGWKLDWEACLSRWLEFLAPRHGQTMSISKRRGHNGGNAHQIGGRASYTVPGKLTSGGAKVRTFISWAVMDKLIEIGVLTPVGGHSRGNGTKYRVDLDVLAALLEQANKA